MFSMRARRLRYCCLLYTSGTVTAEEEISQGWSAFLTGLPLGQWYFDEASTWFLIMAIIIGIVGGVSESRFVKAFINGLSLIHI